MQPKGAMRHTLAPISDTITHMLYMNSLSKATAPLWCSLWCSLCCSQCSAHPTSPGLRVQTADKTYNNMFITCLVPVFQPLCTVTDGDSLSFACARALSLSRAPSPSWPVTVFVCLQGFQCRLHHALHLRVCVRACVCERESLVPTEDESLARMTSTEEGRAQVSVH